MDRSEQVINTPFYVRQLWWLGPLISLFLAFQIEFFHIKQSFDEAADLVVQQIETKVNTFELALAGFANFLAVAGDIDDPEIRTYVQGIRKLYPDLYMFEIAHRTEHAARSRFEQAMVEKGYPNFLIHGFDYDDKRLLTQVDRETVYYPIRFVEPYTEATADVLGLDISSTSTFLLAPLMRSMYSDRPMASRPFELLEGGKGYVIYRPVKYSQEETVAAGVIAVQDFALLVIKAEDLLPNWLQVQGSYTVSMNFGPETSESAKEILIEPNKGLWKNPFLQEITSHQRVEVIDSESQSFELTLIKSLRWIDLHVFWLIVVTLSGSVLAFYLAHRLTLYYHHGNQIRDEKLLLYRRANFDQLTRLPNINLLIDRAEQAIFKAHRGNARLGVCYLDINNFKQINDTFGHQIGDDLLVEIALRLQGVLREEDTAARIHGDEFVVLLTEVEDQPALDLVAAKINGVFSQPFAIVGQSLNINTSIGSALYPDDATDIETLMNISDQQMYKQKHGDNSLCLRPVVINSDVSLDKITA